MPVRSPAVLISGAGVAGPVLAFWLHRLGFRPTVVERAPQLRAGGGGHAVDLFGPAVDIMDWMGVLPEVSGARTTTEIIALVRSGRRPVEVPAEMASEGVSRSHVEILRGDLVDIVWRATSQKVEYVFGDSVTALHDDGHGVDVTFQREPPRRFDLVVGADGLHSTTRSLVFGPEESFTRFLGGYLAAYTVSNELGLHHRMVTFSAPGRTTALYPVGDESTARVLLLWRTPRPLDYDRHDPAAQRRLIAALYGDLGWEVPRLVRALSRPTISTWTRSARS